MTRGRRQVLSLLDPLVQKYLLTGTNVRLLTQLGDGSAAFVARRQRRAAQPVDRGCREEPRRRR